MRSEIEKVIKDNLAGVTAALAEAMTDAVAQALKAALDKNGTAPKAKAATKAKTATPAKVKTEKATERKERDMRCRYTDSEGKRCRKRSKGPRFRFLCAEHIEAKPAAKPAEPVAAETAPVESAPATE